MSRKEIEKVLEEAADMQDELLVKELLNYLEMEFRKVCLNLLHEVTASDIVLKCMYSEIASLQHPSWGCWNGFLLGLLRERRRILNTGSIEQRELMNKSEELSWTSIYMEQTKEIEDEKFKEKWVKLAGQSFGNDKKKTLKIRELLSIPIQIRNRVAHDNVQDKAWWEDVKYVLSFIIKWYLTSELESHHANISTGEPWLFESDGQLWCYNGIDTRGGENTVFYVSISGKSKVENQRAGSIMLAFKKILGEENLQEANFKKLMNKLAPEELRGFFLGGYIVGEKSGEGGFAEVFKGIQLSTGRKVALKILKAGLSEKDKERFLQEAKYLSIFDHANIAKVYEQDEQPWRKSQLYDLSGEKWFNEFKKSHGNIITYIAMEWVEGKTLDDIYMDMKNGEGDYEERKIAQWLMDASEALEVIHNANLIHRDISPKNIMINEDGIVKLMDFGISRTQFENHTIVTSHGQLLGSEPYMSPEQLDYERARAELGPRSDIYSLGSTFYELFTRTRLYNHNNDAVSIATASEMKKRGERPKIPSTVNKAISWEISTILMGCLENEPADRYKSAQKLKEDIKNYLNNWPIEYRRPNLTRRINLLYRRNRFAINLSMSFVILIIFLTTFYIYSVVSERNRVTQQRNEALKSQSRYLTDVGKQQLKLGNKTLAMRLALKALPTDINSPDRPYVSEAEALLSNAIYDTSECRSIIENNSLLGNMEVSPDGNYILTMNYSSYNSLSLWSINSGKCILNFGVDGYQPRKAVFSPDGSKIAVAYWAGGVHILNSRTGKEIKNIGDKGNFTDVQYSRDGKLIKALTYEGLEYTWNTSNYEKISCVKAQGMEFGITDYNSDGSIMARADSSGIVSIWDTKKGGIIKKFKPHEDALTHISISPDGKKIITCSWDKTACIWDVDSGKKLFTLKHDEITYDKDPAEPDNPIVPIIVFSSFSKDGRYVLTSSYSGTAIMWNVSTGEKVKTFAHNGKVIKAFFNFDGSKVITASLDHTIKIWDLKKSDINKKYSLGGYKNSNGNSYFQYVYKTSYDNIGIFEYRDEDVFPKQIGIKLIDLISNRELKFIQYEEPIESITVSPKGDKAIIFTQDKHIDLLDMKTMKISRIFQSGEKISSLVYSKDENTIAYETNSEKDKVEITIYSLVQRKEINKIESELGDRLDRLILNSDGSNIALVTKSSSVSNYTSHDTWKIKIWLCRNGKLLVERTVTGLANDFTFSDYDNSFLASSFDITSAELWNVSKGNKLISLKNDIHWGDDGVKVTFSPNGRYAVIMTDRSEGAGAELLGQFKLHVYDLSECKEIINSTTHKGFIEDVEFNKDCSILAIAGGDSKLSLWNLKTGTELSEFALSGNFDQDVKFNYSGDYITVICPGNNNDYSISNWRIFESPQQAINYARKELVDYTLTDEEKEKFFCQ